MKKEQIKMIMKFNDIIIQLTRIVLLLTGYCPYCKQYIKGWKFVNNLDFVVNCKKLNINIYTGHKNDCEYPDIKL